MTTSGETTLHFDGEHHRLCHGEAAEDILRRTVDSTIFRRSRDNDHSKKDPTFSDWSFYQQLREHPGCVGVEISQFHVDHSSWFLTGIQATYKSTFGDGQPDMETEAPKHEFGRFRYRQYGKSMRSTFVVQEGEYITNLSFRTVDHIIDRVTIVTNLRQISFGSPDISNYPKQYVLPTYSNNESIVNLPYRRVVALAGVTSGMAEEVGCFSESMHWMRLKPYILMRTLVEQNRAENLPVNISKSEEIQQEDEVLKALVINIDDDIFRRVLSFLVPNTGSSL